MIRPATQSDLLSISELNALVQLMHAKNHPNLILSPSAGVGFDDWFATVIDNPESIVLVAELSNRVVGYIYAEEVSKPASWVSPPRHYLMLHHIGVNTDSQGRGVGQKLMDGIYEEAKNRSVLRVELEVWNFNEKARRFFAHYGFNDLRCRMDIEVEK